MHSLRDATKALMRIHCPYSQRDVCAHHDLTAESYVILSNECFCPWEMFRSAKLFVLGRSWSFESPLHAAIESSFFIITEVFHREAVSIAIAIPG
jgi:hypothetical protein